MAQCAVGCSRMCKQIPVQASYVYVKLRACQLDGRGWPYHLRVRAANMRAFVDIALSAALQQLNLFRAFLPPLHQLLRNGLLVQVPTITTSFLGTSHWMSLTPSIDFAIRVTALEHPPQVIAA
eukprot:CAMPEP_0170183148 /NCGR_PEP_ID=MMETSP0040_2-20121228/29760_1 /TAXON_ID=641309 /ORGANISM="Lotharella oceanica, Strain CCMP622" /LENGTH=122 /DNA_ID=CAMNT_0010428787 /DNA_START=119 /DNA_END=488 /DNA_ORIENTATION=+